MTDLNLSLLPPRKKITIDNTNIFYNFQLKPNTFLSEVFHGLKWSIDNIVKKYGKIIVVKIVDNKLQNFMYVRDFSRISRTFIDNFVLKNFDVDSDVSWIQDLLIDLCKNRKIPDSDFLINADYETPLILKSDKRPFHTVFSFNTSDEYKDLAFPTFPDFQRCVKNIFGIEYFLSMKWVDKDLEFLYRGDSINKGLYIDNDPVNTKFKLVDVMKRNFTSIENTGISMFETDVPLTFDNGKTFFKVKKYKELEATKEINIVSKSKFIFVVDSICAPEEMSMIMFSGSCILRVKSKWQRWFDQFLTPGIHYLTIDENLSNLEEMVNWCLEHDNECADIGKACRAAAVKYLSYNSMLDYMQLLIYNSKELDYSEVKNNNYIQTEYQDNYLINRYTVNDYINFVNYNILKHYNCLDWNWNAAIQKLIINTKEANVLEKVADRTLTRNNFEESINNAFIGVNAINALTREIPNFIYTFYSESESATDYVVYTSKLKNAVTLKEYLKYANNLTEIYIQIFMSLQLAWERLCFVHGNLSLENIMIVKSDNPIKIIYNLVDKAWGIDTKNIVIIKDFSKSLILSEFNDDIYKSQRMFIGTDITNPNFETSLHVKANKDVKYLFKKIGGKIYEKILKIDDNSEPIEVMKAVISKSDITNSKIRFGAIKDIEPEVNNAAIIYDSLTSKEPRTNAVSRITSNGIPSESNPIANSIAEYEILQTLRSNFGTVNFRVHVDLQTSEQIKKLVSMVKKHYSKLIKETAAVDLIKDVPELWTLKMLIQKYLYYMLKNPIVKSFISKIIGLSTATIQDAISSGTFNTNKFYKK